jgi:hypothetical protein
MAACGHCGACCSHCAMTCVHMGGGSPTVIAPAFYGGGYFYEPYIGGSLFHLHRHHHDAAQNAEGAQDQSKDGTTVTKVNCDALTDPEHPEHRAAVQAVSHVDEAQHHHLIERIKEELHKHAQSGAGTPPSQ